MDVVNSKNNSRKKERWSLIGTPPMQEPRLMELGQFLMEKEVDDEEVVVVSVIVINCCP